jgi:hypothetical protein
MKQQPLWIECRIVGQYVQMLVGTNSSILFFLAAGASAGADDSFLIVAIAE